MSEQTKFFLRMLGVSVFTLVVLPPALWAMAKWVQFWLG